MPSDMTIRNALTIDVEDYFQVSGFERDISRESWDQFPTRVVQNTRRILSLLAHRDIKATFFVLGWVAERYPELVRDIDHAGHEVGSHSYWHRLVYHLTPEEFREDLRRSRDVLEAITGKPVTSYRAPSFSITSKSIWALDILADEGFKVDASVFPIRHHRCGIPDAPTHPYIHESDTANLWEFPASVARIGNTNFPISGGGYFRLLPYSVTSRLLHRVNRSSFKTVGACPNFSESSRKNGTAPFSEDGFETTSSQPRPFVFYIHPWELDPEQPRLNVSTRAMRFCHYVNLSTTEEKLKRLLTDFSFDRVDNVLNGCVTPNSRPNSTELAEILAGRAGQGVISNSLPGSTELAEVLAGRPG
jgi:polysaccharide deacetylase family protein (PEP-CTERM system associated)